LDVKLEATKSDEAATITKANFDIQVKAEASEDKIQRIFKLTLENCSVGKLFEKAGVKTSYKMETMP